MLKAVFNTATLPIKTFKFVRETGDEVAGAVSKGLCHWLKVVVEVATVDATKPLVVEDR